MLSVATSGGTSMMLDELETRASWAEAHVDHVHANAIARRDEIRTRAASIPGML